MKITNDALLGKWLWWVGDEHDGLWKQIILAKYSVHRDGTHWKACIRFFDSISSWGMIEDSLLVAYLGGISSIISFGVLWNLDGSTLVSMHLARSEKPYFSGPTFKGTRWRLRSDS